MHATKNDRLLKEARALLLYLCAVQLEQSMILVSTIIIFNALMTDTPFSTCYDKGHIFLYPCLLKRYLISQKQTKLLTAKYSI